MSVASPSMVEIDQAWAGESGATLDALRASRQVQLWTVSLTAEAAKQAEYGQTLSADERQRAEGFRFARDRERYISARGTLRFLLAQYLSAKPDELVFTYGTQGKPAIAGTDLQFNLAHSEDYALYAFGAGGRIGVDLEKVRLMPDHEALARRFFSADECGDLEKVANAEREQAFFACWTRKEAYVKAVGTGLSLPLDSFRVAFLPGAPPELLASQDGRRWTLFDVLPAAGYRGAVAVEGMGWTLHAMRAGRV